MTKHFRKIGMALALAGVLSATAPTISQAQAASSATSWVCPYIAKTITYVQGLTGVPSWIVSWVVKELQKLQSQYC